MVQRWHRLPPAMPYRSEIGVGCLKNGVYKLVKSYIQFFSSYAIRFIADREGTHWYHGQLPRHEANGIFGAFIVYRPNKENDHNMDFDAEYVATLQVNNVNPSIHSNIHIRTFFSFYCMSNVYS